MPSQNPNPAWLTIHSSNKLKYDVELWGGISWTIGRSQSCRIVIEDRYASRLHAVINSVMFQHQFLYFVMDNNTVNGTLLNGNSLVYPTLLHDQDVMVMGTTILAFHYPTMFEVKELRIIKEIQKFSQTVSKSIPWTG
ncbi:FHA domain-containing protein [Synechococcus sp. PCC 6312]|uniref:FHA domain-containing protein n=1 Tax=Synechococcus sp. (strain ATCC 27167 / PCC 6312) TaxID=195253 RepID=UPI00029EEF38|nr:FHA domain-containing protein [Synechococcus sp. PCC 6312]AFY62654.1 FHA domain-containing protein [Synechococcus sp. PCC 6312]